MQCDCNNVLVMYRRGADRKDTECRYYGTPAGESLRDGGAGEAACIQDARARV